ncbi:MAG TPA: methylenetetrahydrofolate reductase C-terminal domain-containing protein [Pseudonocardia sp.]|nr:methylenetetrahydrofolate reductase C-terminal domain-containing protein [Pseudonocardia sp.]
MDPGGTCPKHMVHGPCGGVRAHGGCEVEPLPCPWVGEPTVAWSGPVDPRLRIPAPAEVSGTSSELAADRREGARPGPPGGRPARCGPR